MKLKAVHQFNQYQFELTFVNGFKRVMDLKPLIGAYVSEEKLNTAHVDQEWGCLEFEHGRVDISPKTLYRFCMEHSL